METTRVVIAHRDTVVLLRAGLRAHEWVSPDLRLPVPRHSGIEQIFDSFTVAGAAPDWFLRTHRLPVSPRAMNSRGEPEVVADFSGSAGALSRENRQRAVVLELYRRRMCLPQETLMFYTHAFAWYLGAITMRGRCQADDLITIHLIADGLARQDDIGSS